MEQETPSSHGSTHRNLRADEKAKERNSLPVLWHNNIKHVLAGLAFIIWTSITYKLFFSIPPELAPTYKDLYDTLTWVVWLYISAAMGMSTLNNAYAMRFTNASTTTDKS